MRTAIVYYSYSGNTHRVASLMAEILKNKGEDGLIIKANGVTVDLNSRPIWESSYLLATVILPDPDLAEEKIGERSRQVADFLKSGGKDKKGAGVLVRTIISHLSESIGRNRKNPQKDVAHLRKAIEVMSLVNREIVGPEKVESTEKSLYPQGSLKKGRISLPETWKENRNRNKG